MRAVNRKATSSGFGLIEVLIALVILSIGMLGMATMFASNLSNSRGALFRTQAIALVSDMSDRIRANVGGRDSYDIARYGGAPGEHGCAPDDVPDSGANCSASQLAEDDLARWRDAVRLHLPAAPAGTEAADVQYFAGDPQRYRVTVAWQESQESQPFSFTSEFLVQGAP